MVALCRVSARHKFLLHFLVEQAMGRGGRMLPQILMQWGNAPHFPLTQEV